MTRRQLEELSEPSRELQKQFDMYIEPHRPELWRYCRSMTGSPWDAEDLVQETLMRAYAALPKLWQPIVPKSYLFRIATNAWINNCRKMKRQLDDIVEEVEVAVNDNDPFLTREAIEALVGSLPPRQVVVLLLCEVFNFTAAETAGMIGTTEGAVKAALNRARINLRSRARDNDSEHTQMPVTSKATAAIIEAYLEAFNRRDPDAIAKLMDEHIHHDIVHIAEEHGKSNVRKYSLEDWSKDPIPMVAYAKNLWNRPVIVVMAGTEQGSMLYDVIELEIEGEAIVRKKDYYFCQDLLLAAGQELQVPVHVNGYSFN